MKRKQGSKIVFDYLLNGDPFEKAIEYKRMLIKEFMGYREGTLREIEKEKVEGKNSVISSEKIIGYHDSIIKRLGKEIEEIKRSRGNFYEGLF